jgi:hypothetical protein
MFVNLRLPITHRQNFWEKQWGKIEDLIFDIIDVISYAYFIFKIICLYIKLYVYIFILFFYIKNNGDGHTT